MDNIERRYEGLKRWGATENGLDWFFFFPVMRNWHNMKEWIPHDRLKEEWQSKKEKLGILNNLDNKNSDR